MSRKEALSSFIQQIHGRPVVVKLNSGVDYREVGVRGMPAKSLYNLLKDSGPSRIAASSRTVSKAALTGSYEIWLGIEGNMSSKGVLACLDGYMNIALEQTEEYVNGQLKNKYGDAFIRGNNVLYISTQKRRI